MIKKKIYILACVLAGILVWAPEAEAQRKKPDNLPKYDLEPYHFGFTLGFNQMHFIITKTEGSTQEDTVFVVSSEPELGFHIGIVSNLRLAPYLDLRFIPTLAFGERIMVFTRANKDTLFFDTHKKVESTLIEFPFELKYKAMRIHNSRAYVLAGFKYTLDLASQAKKKEQDDEIRVKLNKNDYAFEVGVGFDFYTTFFKFGTELKMSYGIRDLLKHEDNIYVKTIERLNSKMFHLTFTFE